MPVTQKGLEGLWLKALVFVLFGYALLDKGFAYLFLGEMILVFGAMVFLKSRRLMLVFSDPVLSIWALFAFWGFCRTIPFLSTYGFDAIRDAVVWGYGFFAVFIVAFVNSSSQISRGLNAYRRFVSWFLPVIPILLLLSLTMGRSLPSLPWGRSILTIKAGDVAVSAGTAAVFLLTFPNRTRAGGTREISIYRSLAFVGLYLAAFIVLTTTRGGFLSIVLAVVSFSILRASKIIWKIAAVGTVGAIFAVALISALPPNFQIGGKSVNAGTVLSSVASIGGGSDTGTGHEGTGKWRLNWWRNIVRETFLGPYFWTGRGFGQNLAVADGPFGDALSEEDVLLRSPHNGSMTILARMGVPGLVLWLALNIVFAARIFRAQRQAAKSGSPFWSGVNLWILAAWLGTFTNLSFDVYLEGPQGGIWYWSIVGIGIAVVRVQKYATKHRLATSLHMQVDDRRGPVKVAFYA